MVMSEQLTLLVDKTYRTWEIVKDVGYYYCLVVISWRHRRDFKASIHSYWIIQ